LPEPKTNKKTLVGAMSRRLSHYQVSGLAQFGRFASGTQATPSLSKKELVPKVDSAPSLCTLPSMLYRWYEIEFRNESKCSTVGNPPVWPGGRNFFYLQQFLLL